MQINGTLQVGEGAAWAAKACGRLTGYPLSLVWAFGVAIPIMGAALLLASILPILFDPLDGFYLPIMLVLILPASMIATRIIRKISVARFRKSLRQRGVEMDLPLEIEVLPEGWKYTLAQVTTRGPWSAISEIFPVGPYWVLMIQGSPLYVPKRYFPTLPLEQAFVSEVLSRLEPDAVARSAAAAKLAAVSYTAGATG